MKASLLRLALLATVMLPVTSAVAADLDPPPPIDDLRPANYDWTGVSIGIFGAANAIDGHYDARQICVNGCVVVDPEMSGIRYGYGAKAGADYQMDSFVFGIAGDWARGGELADNVDPAEATYLNMENLGTLRARLGLADDRTLVYVTGGLAAAEMEFGGLIGPANQVNREDVSDTHWTYGWTIGGGIEHAFTDSLTVNLEYLYIDLEDTGHRLVDSAGVGGRVDMMYNDIHTVRAGVNYRFSL